MTDSGIPHDRTVRQRATRWQLYVLGAVALAIVARIGVFYATAWPYQNPTGPFGSDYAQYHEIACNLLDGNGFTLAGQPNIKRAPGYPVLVAAFYGMFGRTVYPAIAANILLGIGTIVLIAFLGRQLGGDRVGVVAAYLGAINPVLIWYSFRPYSETPFTALTLGAVILLGPAMTDVRWRRVVIGAAIVGLAALFRGQVLPVVFIIAAGWVLLLRWRGVLVSAVFVATLLLVMAPWAIRNYTLTGQFILVNKMAGHVLFVANNREVMESPLLRGAVDENLPYGKGIEPWKPLEDQIAADEFEKEAAIRFIRENIWKMPGYVMVKFARFFSLLTEVSVFQRVYLYTLDVIFFPVSIAGIVVLWKRRRYEFIPAAGMIVATLFTIAVFWGDSRFRSTMAPFYLTLASVVIIDAWDRVKRFMSARHG